MAIVLISLLVLGACAKLSPAWEQDAYVWAAGAEPDADTAALPVARHRLLVLQWRAADGEQPQRFDRRDWVEALPATAMVAVVRLDGSRISVNAASVAHALAATIGKWSRLPVAVEIDHDSATARVPEYTQWLRDFRREWAARTPVWITALPDWRNAPALGELLDSADTYTLQVHAVDRPEQGLLDAERAVAAITAFEAASDTPSFVALPTYQLRVGWDASGTVRFVEGEQAIAASSQHERTLFVDPLQLQSLARQLRDTRTQARRGLAWFRLPRILDRQTLSPVTFAALLRDQSLAQTVEITVRPTAGVGGYDLMVSNRGPFDRALPKRIAWGESCHAGDPAYGYAHAPDRKAYLLLGSGLLRTDEERVIGWIRCATGSAPVIVTPEFPEDPSQ